MESERHAHSFRNSKAFLLLDLQHYAIVLYCIVSGTSHCVVLCCIVLYWRWLYHSTKEHGFWRLKWLGFDKKHTGKKLSIFICFVQNKQIIWICKTLIGCQFSVCKQPKSIVGEVSFKLYATNTCGNMVFCFLRVAFFFVRSVFLLLNAAFFFVGPC